jgi:hypothetical protein
MVYIQTSNARELIGELLTGSEKVDCFGTGTKLLNQFSVQLVIYFYFFPIIKKIRIFVVGVRSLVSKH